MFLNMFFTKYMFVFGKCMPNSKLDSCLNCLACCTTFKHINSGFFISGGALAFMACKKRKYFENRGTYGQKTVFWQIFGHNSASFQKFSNGILLDYQ